MKITDALPKIIIHRKVAAYCRVSNQQKIQHHSPKGLRLLTIYASMCQNESERKSANTYRGIRTRFANGTSAIANTPCYGYRQDGRERLAPVEEEAKVVRMIYDYRRRGMSLRKIARELSNRGISSPRDKPEWSIETIRRILQNEKYIGHVLLQKRTCPIILQVNGQPTMVNCPGI